MNYEPLEFDHNGQRYEVRASMAPGRVAVDVFQGGQKIRPGLGVLDEAIVAARAKGVDIIAERLEAERQDFIRNN